jgi:DNA-binding transcriptional ArsR family regulator
VDAFTAIANPVRRRILELLAESPRNAGSIAEKFELSRSAVSEHLSVLRTANLVHEEIRGRERHYSISPEPLAEVGDWLAPFARYWRERLALLADYLEQEPDP